ncbi:hypothetical protein [Actinokineospora pegani]|uniref:hypothetical protein n=1 Tax=Actinokineospora pegani TaxID=2654637 RepID=UPI0012EAB8D5|nr:hypothetical protein [Actinokineospora pegani]
MSVYTPVRPVTTPADLAQLSKLVAEPESTLADPPLSTPNAAGGGVGALLLGLGLLLSPPTPKEPRR